MKEQPCNELWTGGMGLTSSSDVLSRRKTSGAPCFTQLIITRWEDAGAADGPAEMQT